MKTSLLSTFALMTVASLALAQPPGMGMGPGGGMGPGAGMGPCNPETMPCGPGNPGQMGNRHDRMMKKLDTDGDGKISLAEHNAMAEKRFARFDTNGDGTVTKEEFVARSAERFKKADANGDGFITQDERKGMRAKYMSKRGGMQGQGGPMPDDAPAGE